MLSSDVLNVNFLPSFSLTIEVIKVSAGRFISLIFRLKYLAITLRASSGYGCPATRLR